MPPSLYSVHQHCCRVFAVYDWVSALYHLMDPCKDTQSRQQFVVRADLQLVRRSASPSLELPAWHYVTPDEMPQAPLLHLSREEARALWSN